MRNPGSTLLALLFLSFFAVGPPASHAFEIFGEKFDGERAKTECEAKGKLISQGPTFTPGYLLTSDFLFSIYDIGKELLTKRFAYFEINQRYWANPDTKKSQRNDIGNLEKLAVGNGSKYIRFYLAKRGDPACAGFEADIKDYPSQNLTFLREHGLPRNMCIAAERTDLPASRYEMHIETTHKIDRGEYYSWHYVIRDRETGNVHSEVTHVEFYGRDVFRCPNIAEVSRLRDEVLIATPHAALPSPNQVLVDDDPPEFPFIREATVHLLEEKDSSQRITDSDVGLGLRPIAEEGEVSFSPRYHSRGNGVANLDGYHLNIIRDGVLKRILVRVEGGKFITFKKIVVDNGKIIFLAERQLSSTDSERWLLQYSIEGQPLIAYRLIFPPIIRPTKKVFLVGDFLLTNEKLAFSFLAWDDVPGRVVKEYKFEASLQ